MANGIRSFLFKGVERPFATGRDGFAARVGRRNLMNVGGHDPGVRLGDFDLPQSRLDASLKLLGPGERGHVTFLAPGGESFEAVTGKDGRLTLSVDKLQGDPSIEALDERRGGMVAIGVSTPDGTSDEANLLVLPHDYDGPVFISDIDDTLRSTKVDKLLEGVTQPPIPGVAEVLGAAHDLGVPIIYLSAGFDRLHPDNEAFLAQLPPGILLDREKLSLKDALPFNHVQAQQQGNFKAGVIADFRATFPRAQLFGLGDDKYGDALAYTRENVTDYIHDVRPKHDNLPPDFTGTLATQYTPQLVDQVRQDLAAAIARSASFGGTPEPAAGPQFRPPTTGSSTRSGPYNPELASPWEIASWNNPIPKKSFPQKAAVGVRSVRAALNGIAGDLAAVPGSIVERVLARDFERAKSMSDERLGQLFWENPVRFAKLADAAATHFGRRGDSLEAPQFLRLLEIATQGQEDFASRAGLRDRLLSRMSADLAKALPPAVYEKLQADRAADGARPQDVGALNRYLDALTGSQVRAGNEIQLLIDGDQAFPSIFRDIRNARTSVLGTMFGIDADETGQEFLDACLASARSGAKVRIVYDQLGSAESTGRRGMIEQLRTVAQQERLDLQVVAQDSSTLLRHLTHRKALVLDGTVAYVQDMNMGHVYRYNWHGMSQRIKGPLVNDVTSMLVEQLRRNGVQLPAEEVERLSPPQPTFEDGMEARLVEHLGRRDQDLEYALIRMIDSETERVDLTTPYFDNPNINAAILRAQARGVASRIYVPEHDNKKIMGMDAKGLVRTLEQDNGTPGHGTVEVLAYAGAPMSHMKTYAFRSLGAYVEGSTNLDDYSLSSPNLRLGNDEASVVVRSSKLTDAIGRMFDGMRAQSYPLRDGGGMDDWLAKVDATSV